MISPFNLEGIMLLMGKGKVRIVIISLTKIIYKFNS